jgi:RNA polymerase sigma factor (sigma-70 family)
MPNKPPKELDDSTLAMIIQWSRVVAYKAHCHEGPFDRDDLAQEAAIAAIRAYFTWDPLRATMETYLKRVMRYRVIDVIREYLKRRTEEGKQKLYKDGTYRDHETLRFGVLMDWGGEYSHDIVDVIGLERNDDGTHEFQVHHDLKVFKMKFRLKGMEWKVLYNRYGLGMTNRESAERLHLSDSTVIKILKGLRQRFPQLSKGANRSMKSDSRDVSEEAIS